MKKLKQEELHICLQTLISDLLEEQKKDCILFTTIQGHKVKYGGFYFGSGVGFGFESGEAYFAIMYIKGQRAYYLYMKDFWDGRVTIYPLISELINMIPEGWRKLLIAVAKSGKPVELYGSGRKLIKR